MLLNTTNLSTIYLPRKKNVMIFLLYLLLVTRNVKSVLQRKNRILHRYQNRILDYKLDIEYFIKYS